MKKIVIVGGGIAGFGLIKKLQKAKVAADIVLVEPREFLEVPFAQLRALTQSSTFSPTIRKNFSELMEGVKHIKDRLISVEDSSISLESGTSVSFDILVLATGSRFKQWEILNGTQVDIASRQTAIESESAKLAAANSILIIGGGAVGVEMAGEIAAQWPEKKVTLVEGANRILSMYSEKMTARGNKLLSDLGVEIHTNSFWTKQENGSWNDSEGKSREFDLVIPAVGINANSEWAGNISLTETGAVKVNPDLRIADRSNVFVIGNLNDVIEGKTGINAGNQAKHTARNIKALIADEKAILKPYKPGPVMGIIPVGHKKSAVQLPFGHLHFMGAIKQKDLFVSMYLGK